MPYCTGNLFRKTTSDGKIDVLVGNNGTAYLTQAVYKLHFLIGDYFKRQNKDVFFPYIDVSDFSLLLSLFSYFMIF